MMSEDKERLTEHAKVFLTSYLNLVVVTRAENPSWRKGQTYFNVLTDVRPDLADLIRGTGIDPYHQDCNLAAFLGQISTMWNV